MANYLGTARGGMVDQPGTWSSPSPAGGAPVRQVATQPVTLPRQSKLTSSTFDIDSLFRSPQEQSAFVSPSGISRNDRNALLADSPSFDDLNRFSGAPGYSVKNGDLSLYAPYGGAQASMRGATAQRLTPSSAGIGPLGVEGMTQQQVGALGGWGVDPKTGALAYSNPSAPVNPALAAATQAGQGVAPPFPAPVDDRLNARAKAYLAQPPVQVAAANPGMGGAMIGSGQMSPQIPPQQPPADGSSPLPVWNDGGAGASPQVTKALIARPAAGAAAYDAKNNSAVQNALLKQQGATGTAAGRQYVNGQQVGYAPITVGNGAAAQTLLPTNGGTAYGLSNAAGQIRALDRQAAANGQTGTTIYRNGQKVGNVGGGSSAQAYATAAARSRSGPSGGNGVASSTNPWGY